MRGVARLPNGVVQTEKQRCCRAPRAILGNVVPNNRVVGNNRAAVQKSCGYIFLWTRKVIAMLSRFSKIVGDFLKREDGPTAVEYAVMLALIIVVCIAAITSLGTNANATFTSVSNTIGSSS
jgi:pilus assembly protein Flp/PilA